jgi:F-type H+-transporting ATPase subunit epsilon
MRLRITTPLDVIIDADGIDIVSAEDASGSFGIQPHHTDFLTSLAVSVVSWTCGGGARQYCAVRGGVLTVTRGQDVAIATREAIAGDDLAVLDQKVLARFREDREAERAEFFDSTQMQLNAIRQIVRHLRPGGTFGLEFGG